MAVKNKGMSSATIKRLAKQGKGPQSAEARAKRAATMRRKAEEREAARMSDAGGAMDIPLDNIPDRPFSNASVRRKGDERMAKKVVIEAPGGIRITIQFSE